MIVVVKYLEEELRAAAKRAILERPELLRYYRIASSASHLMTTIDDSEVGVFRRYGRLVDGSICDCRWFEVIGDAGRAIGSTDSAFGFDQPWTSHAVPPLVDRPAATAILRDREHPGWPPPPPRSEEP